MPDQEIARIAAATFPAGSRPPTATVSGVTAIIPRNIGEVLEMARVVIRAGLAPASYEVRPTSSRPEDVQKAEEETRSRIVIGIMKGAEVGFPPITALSTIAIINNRACIWGDGAVALVQSRGVLDKIEEVWEGAVGASKGDPIPNDFSDDYACVFKIWRKGQPNPYVGRFSVRDAKRAHLWGRKQPWQQYPKRMLLARARAFALRDGFADCLMGLAIAEEIQDLPVEAVKVNTSFLDDAPALPAPAEVLPLEVALPGTLSAETVATLAETPPVDDELGGHPHDDNAADLANRAPEVARPPLAGPDPEPQEAEPTEDEIAEWTRWGTAMTTKLATCRDLASLAKLEKHFHAQAGIYLAILGAEKRLAMEELIAVRRQELSSEKM